MASNSSSFIEYFASSSFRNLDAKDNGFHSPFFSCCRTVPRPDLLASQNILSGQSLLKWFNAVTFLIPLFTCSNAFFCSFFHSQFVSFFKSVLEGKQIVARLGMNLLKCSTAPEYDLSCFKFVGFNLSEIPCTLLFTGATPCCDSLYPTHLMLSAAKVHLSSFKFTFASSNLLSTSITF